MPLGSGSSRCAVSGRGDGSHSKSLNCFLAIPTHQHTNITILSPKTMEETVDGSLGLDCYDLSSFRGMGWAWCGYRVLMSKRSVPALAFGGVKCYFARKQKFL